MSRLWYPTESDVDEIAGELCEQLFPEYDSPPHFRLLGSDGANMLASALSLPRQPYYRTIYDKAGVLLRSMIKNHPFLDGNKRMGMAVTTVFLLMNYQLFLPTSGEMLEYALDVAKSEPDMPWRDISGWIRERCYPLRKDPVLALTQIMREMPRTEDVRDRLLKRWTEIEKFLTES